MQSFEMPEADLVCPSISSISSLPLHFVPPACVLLFPLRSCADIHRSSGYF